MEIILVAILGLCIGSFIAAHSYRLVRNIPISKGRSFCDNCKHQIEWFNNIPVLSYLLLGGKCAHCKKHISVRYPLIEFFSSLSFVGVYLTRFTLLDSFPWFVSPLLITGFFCLLAALSIGIIATEIDDMIIPDVYIFTLFGVLFSIMLFLPVDDIWLRLFTAFASSLFFLILHLVTRGRGMGLGDVKLALVGGFLFGFPLSIVWLFISFLLGAVIGVLFILFGKTSLKAKIAFGPFMILSMWIVAYFGNALVHYLVPYF